LARDREHYTDRDGLDDGGKYLVKVDAFDL
jgi:hypothetical protein